MYTRWYTLILFLFFNLRGGCAGVLSVRGGYFLLYALFFLYVHAELFPDISGFDSFQPTGLEDMIDARYEPSSV